MLPTTYVLVKKLSVGIYNHMTFLMSYVTWGKWDTVFTIMTYLLNVTLESILLLLFAKKKKIIIIIINSKLMIFFFFFFWIGSKLLLFINYLQKQLKILINYILQPHYTQVSKKKKWAIRTIINTLLTHCN